MTNPDSLLAGKVLCFSVQFTAPEGFSDCWFCPGFHYFRVRCLTRAKIKPTDLLVSIIAFDWLIVGRDYATKLKVGQQR